MTALQAPAPPSGLRFELPPELSATAPPEARGLARDDVRLLVATSSSIVHGRFSDLPEQLAAGDIVVVNTSATLPAAVDGRHPSHPEVVVHIAGPNPDGEGWVIELRRPDGRGPVRDAAPGDRVELAGGAQLRLVRASTDGETSPSVAAERGGTPPGGYGHQPSSPTGPRLWVAEVDGGGSLTDHLDVHGRPISYGYVPQRWPLSSYQTVFGRVPGSAEMVSAARPFSDRLVTDLVSRGITVAPIVLHTGVSSLEAGEPPQPERFVVSEHTAALVRLTRSSGGRVLAVGTTATRALESVADLDGMVRGGSGWTDLVLGPDRPARVVDGLITGWHESDASHLALLEAVAGPQMVERAYTAALAHGYLWHEFGDSCLLLP